MRKSILSLVAFAAAVAAFAPSEPVAGQRRAVVRPNRGGARVPALHSRLVVRAGHPIRRALPSRVLLRPARRIVTIASPLVFLPSLTWREAAASLPPSERLVWQETESIGRDEGWVDANFGVDSFGNKLFLDIKGKTRLNFAEIVFANGQVQVVDFDDQTRGIGIYTLLDLTDGRHVKTVRLLAKSETDESKLIVYLGRN